MPNVSLYAGEATPSNVVLRSFPLPAPAAVTYDVVLFVESAAPVLAPPVISPVLFAGDASPSTVILRPLVIADRTLGPVNVILRVAGAASPSLVRGSLNATLDALTLVATGTVTGSGVGVTGTLSQTLADAILSGTATVLVSGVLTQTLADAALSGTGTVLISGTLAQTLADTTLVSTGGVLVSATLASTLADLALSATGTVAASATGNHVRVYMARLNRGIMQPSIGRLIKQDRRVVR